MSLNAGDKVWVCEEGHVDDHHLEDGGVCTACGGSGVGDHGPEPDPVCAGCGGSGRATNTLCSRCGGECRHWTLDRLAAEYVERLRVNVGIIAENRQLKGQLREANLRTVAEVLGAVGHHLDAAAGAKDAQAALDRVDAALKLLAPFRDQQEEAPR